MIDRKHSREKGSLMYINPFASNAPFPYPLKTSENSKGRPKQMG